jgi:hypothetical protein
LGVAWVRVSLRGISLRGIGVRLRTEGVCLRISMRGVSPWCRLHDGTLKEEEYFICDSSEADAEDFGRF